MSCEVTKETLIDALDSVTWYNCLAEEILKWKNPENYDTEHKGVPYPDGWLSPKMEFWASWPKGFRNQLEVIWMICVCMFGDYGTSPRSGWIEHKDEFFAFIDAITETYRESEEYEYESSLFEQPS